MVPAALAALAVDSGGPNPSMDRISATVRPFNGGSGAGLAAWCFVVLDVEPDV